MIFAHQTSRPGFFLTRLAVVLAVLASLGAATWYFLPGLNLAAPAETPLFHSVERGPFLHEISESGEVHSSRNVEIRCEVRARGQGGVTILEIVPEGTYVKPGDVLVKLDGSSLEDERTQQEIVCNASEAAVITAGTAVENAKLAKREYIEGTYEQQRDLIKSKIAVSEETKRRAVDYYDYSKKLANRGYITKLRLEADKFAIEKAESDLRAAETELKVLDDFTKAKTVNQLESGIRTAEADLKSKEASYKLDMERLALITSQLEKCTIRAEQPGQVVYANETNHRGDREVIIEAGVMIRERQVIIRLPDPKSMQVTARINEANVANVKVGMPAKIRMDAYPDREFDGIVEKVNEYPAAAAWWAGSVKEYETDIKILGSPDGLKPGLSAEVRILVKQLPDVVAVPVQAVLAHNDNYYCILPKGKSYEARPVKIGSTNDKVVVIESGLESGEQIVLGAFANRKLVDLPEPLRKKKEKTTIVAATDKRGEGERSDAKHTEEEQQTKEAGS